MIARFSSVAAGLLFVSGLNSIAVGAADREAVEKRTAAGETAGIRAELDEAERLSREARSLEAALVAFSRIGAMLDVFEMRFDVQPHETDGWIAIQKRARQLLPRFRDLAKRGVYFEQDSARTAVCVLLELAGEPQEALEELGRIRPGGGCGNWHATVMMAVAERQAGISQRMGDYQAALAYQESAVAALGLSLYNPSPDLLLVRYGFLLAKNGRADEAAAHYQRVVDLHPRTVGDVLARRELTKLGQLIEPTAQRIVSLYLSAGNDEPDDQEESTIVVDLDRSYGAVIFGPRDPEAAIFAFAHHRFPESLTILLERLKTADAWERNRLVPALGELGDPCALPILREIVRVGDDTATTTHALLALHELGDDTEVIPFLRNLQGDGKALGFEIDWLDRSLREIFAGGPQPEIGWNRKGADFASAWIGWLEQRPGAKAGQ